MRVDKEFLQNEIDFFLTDKIKQYKEDIKTFQLLKDIAEASEQLEAFEKSEKEVDEKFIKDIFDYIMEVL